MEYLGNDGLFHDNWNGVSSLTAISPDREDVVNGTLAQMQISQVAQHQPMSSTLDTYPNLLANNAANQFRYEQLDSNGTRQSSITELDQNGPWYPLMNDDVYFQSNGPQWGQQGHRPASIQNLQANLQSGNESSVTTRPRSDSGYGTVPNANKSPHTVSTTTHSLFDGEMPSMNQDPTNLGQDSINLAPDEREALMQTIMNNEFNQFAADYENDSPPPDQLTTSVDFDIPNQPPENGPFVCKKCLQNGDTQAANQKNKSEWK